MSNKKVYLSGSTGLGFIALWSIMMLVGLGILGASIHGLILAFSTSILFGLLVLFVEPLPLVIGLVYWFTGTNLAEKIVEWFQTL